MKRTFCSSSLLKKHTATLSSSGFFLLLFFTSFFGEAQNLSIVNGGTNLPSSAVSNGVLTVPNGNYNLNTDDLVGYLNAGDFTIAANTISISSAVTKTGSSTSTLTLKSKLGGDITITENITAENGALNLVFWTNYDDDVYSGKVIFDGSSSLSISTKGGFLVCGGGPDTEVFNGITIPSKVAQTWDGNAQGILVDNTTIVTDGGDVIMRGLSYVVGSSNGSSNFGVSLVGSSIETSDGNITIEGGLKGKYANGCGIYYTGSNLTTTSGDISFKGIGSDEVGTNDGWRHGVYVGTTENNQTVKISTTSGKISFKGEANFTNTTNTDNSGVQFQVNASTSEIVVGSETGDIEIDGKHIAPENGQFANGIRFTPQEIANSIRIGYDGNTPYSGDITLATNSFLLRTTSSVAGRVSIQSSGTFNFKPKANSFSHLRIDNDEALSFDNTFNFGTTFSSMQFGKESNTYDFTFDNALTINGSLQVYAGKLIINDNITSTADGDIFLKSQNDTNGSFLLKSGKTIEKTDGSGTVTFQGDAHIIVNGTIQATGNAMQNVVLWSDYDGDGNDGGVSLSGDIATQGGHVWAGGSNSANGSATWNGIAVGDGPSDGANGYNQNAFDFSGNINTNGGDVLLWAGTPHGASRTLFFYDSYTLNSGSGDITIIADDVEGGTGDQLTIESTGTFTFKPNGTAWNASEIGTQLDVSGTFSNDTFTGSGDADWFKINNVSSLGGLTIGKNGITSYIATYTPWEINGPISFYAKNIGLGDDLSSTLAAADILLKASGNITLDSSVDITTNSGDVFYWADADADGAGNISFAGGVGQHITTNGGNVIMGGGAGTALPTGYADGSTSAPGINFNHGGTSSVIINTTKTGATGGDITLKGKTSGDFDGLFISNVQFFGNDLILDGQTPTSSKYGVRLGSSAVYNGSNLSMVIDMDNDLTITAVNTASNYAGNALRTGANPRIYADGDITINSSGKLDYTSNQTFLNINPEKTLSVNFDGTANFTTSLGDPSASNAQGALVIQSFQQDSFTSDFSSSSWTFNSNLSGLTIGKSTNTSEVNLATVASIAGPISVYGGDLAINAATTATNSDINLYASGAVTQSAALTANRLSLNGIGTFTLQNSANNVGTIAGGDTTTRLGNVSYRDANALEIGSINTDGIFSSGTILIETETENLTLSENINTTSNSDDAIILNAGRTATAGTATGGDVIVSGTPTLTYGSGGRAKLFSGRASNSTGLTTLVGGDTNVRGGFDESSTISPAMADDNSYAIYRQADGAGDLHIVASGGDAINTTWRFELNQIITTNATVKVNASVVENYLASNDLALIAGNIIVEEEVVSSSSTALILKAKGAITVNSNQKIQTNNGDVILWADADADNEGRIAIGNGVIFNTVNGVTTSGLSGGGKIILAGGADDGANSGTAADGIPDGYARSASDAGIALSTDGNGNVSFYSGGGDVVMYGYSSGNESSVLNNIGINQQGGLFINTGSGRIRMIGKGVNHYGINLNQNAAVNALKLELISAATTGDAIYVKGTSESELGLVFNFNSFKELKATNGGAILAEGSGGGSNQGIFVQNSDFLATSGSITLDGGANGIVNRNTGNTYGFRSGSDITSSTSAIIFKGDALSFNIGGMDTFFNTSGTVTLEPSGTSFSSALTYPIRNVRLSSEVSGITLGKTGNTADINISNAITVSGPISVFGGDIAIESDLSVGENILTLDATGAVTQTSGSGITAGTLTLLNEGDFTLTETTNAVTKLEVGTDSEAVGTVAFVNANALTLAKVQADGKIALATQEGDITIKEDITTQSVAADAVVVNAGKNANKGVTTGGDIKIEDAPTISTGANGIIQLLSGTAANSTGLSALADTFKAYADETSNFTFSVGTTNVLYRDASTTDNNSLYFDGANDYVALNESPLADGATEFTIELWIKPDASNFDDTDYHAIFGHQTGATYTRPPSLYLKEGKIHVDSYRDSDLQRFDLLTDRALVKPAVWTHIALVKDALLYYVYINGEEAIQFTAPDAVSVPGTYNFGFIGNYFGGNIDEVRFWSTPRSQSQIATTMNVQLNGDEQNLLAYYTFNQGSANATNTGLTTLYSAKTNSTNVGTLNNLALTGSTSNWTYGFFPQISGQSYVFKDDTIALTHADSGGVWSVDDTSKATISTTGVLTGVASGEVEVTYTIGDNSTVKQVVVVDENNLGDITIVNSGGANEGSGWVYSDGFIFATQATVNINVADVNTKLNTNNLTISGNKISFNTTTAIATTTSNNFKIRSNTHIDNAAATEINTNGGDVLFAANSDDADDNESTINGYINFRQGLTITTQGGDITLGGGDESGSGYAEGVVEVNGFSTEGVRIDNVLNLSSDGGAIVMRGKSANTSITNSGTGASGVGFYALNADGIIDSGDGTIYIEGVSQLTTATNYSSGIVLGLNGGKLLTITSSNTTENAIILNGSATANVAENYGIEVEINSPLTLMATGNGGGVTVNTGVAFTDNNNRYEAVFRSQLQVLAKSGPIQLNGSQFGGVANGVLHFDISPYFGSKSGTEILTSTSDITFSHDQFSWNNNDPYFATTGVVTIAPENASFYHDNVRTSWFQFNQNSQVMSGLVFGKSGNTKNILFDTATTVAGPISVFGSDISISTPLTATNSSIDLSASGTVTQTAALTANTLSLKGEGNFTLTNTSNSVQTIAAGSTATPIGLLNFVNSDALTIGTIGTTKGINATGAISIGTKEGDITVTLIDDATVKTTDTSADAIVINAGIDADIDEATGGNIVLGSDAAGQFATGTNGIVKLFSGEANGSTNLSALVGGNSNIRLDVDETTTAFDPVLENGEVYALYRKTVVAPPVISLATTNYTSIVNEALTAITSTSSGGAVASYSIAPALPSGLVIDTTTGVISGTPTVTVASTQFTITATNGSGTDTAVFNLVIHTTEDADNDGIYDVFDTYSYGVIADNITVNLDADGAYEVAKEELNSGTSDPNMTITGNTFDCDDIGAVTMLNSTVSAQGFTSIYTGGVSLVTAFQNGDFAIVENSIDGFTTVEDILSADNSFVNPSLALLSSDGTFVIKDYKGYASNRHTYDIYTYKDNTLTKIVSDLFQSNGGALMMAEGDNDDIWIMSSEKPVSNCTINLRKWDGTALTEYLNLYSEHCYNISYVSYKAPQSFYIDADGKPVIIDLRGRLTKLEDGALVSVGTLPMLYASEDLETVKAVTDTAGNTYIAYFQNNNNTLYARLLFKPLNGEFMVLFSQLIDTQTTASWYEDELFLQIDDDGVTALFAANTGQFSNYELRRYVSGEQQGTVIKDQRSRKRSDDWNALFEYNLIVTKENGDWIFTVSDGGDRDRTNPEFNRSIIQNANKVTYTTQDVDGNAITGTVGVNVLDVTAPILTAEDTELRLVGTTNATIASADFTASVTDNCSVDTITLSKTSFGTEDIGENTVTITATDTSGNQATQDITVTVYPPKPTVATTSYTYCEGETATAISVSALTDHTLVWYSTETATEALAEAPTVDTATPATTSYFVSQQSSGGLESNREEITITVIATPTAPTANSVAYCINETTVALAATALSGHTLQWYEGATGGAASTTAPTPNTTTAGTVSYYVSQLNNTSGCESDRTKIDVVVAAIPAAPTASDVAYCKDEPAIALTVTAAAGHTLQWYEGATGGTASTTAPIPSTVEVGTVSYYVSQVHDDAGCEGPRTKIDVTVNAIPDAPTANDVSYCKDETAVALIATALSGHTLQWYEDATGGAASTIAPIPSTTTAGTVSYYVSQLNDATGCEGSRTKIDVTVNAISDAPIVSDVAYCINETAIALTATAAAGHTLQWYEDATGGTASTTAPTPNTTTAGTVSYYVSQLNNTSGCESDRTKIDVVVAATPAAPTASDVAYCKDETAIALTATAAAGHTLQWYEDVTGGTASTTAPIPSTVEAGTVSYYVSQVHDSAGCEGPRTKVEVTVSENPSITGESTVTANDSISLTATTAPATSNAWVSSDTSKATVNASGEVTGVAAGTTIVTYTNINGCSVTKTITIIANTTEAPVLTLPATDTRGATTLNISYTLPEAALSATVKLTFSPTDASGDVVWVMADATTVAFDYVVGADPTAITSVVSGNTLSFKTYDVTLSYQDAFGSSEASATNTNIQTLAAPVLSFSEVEYNGVINVALANITPVSTGGTVASYAIAPALPAGVSLDATTGVISGTPTIGLPQTQFTVTATNGAGSDTATFKLFVDADTDGDGEGDTTDDDMDGDGIPNDEDADADGDGTDENGTDTDGDGTNDEADDDIDGDGIPNDEDADVDGDGTDENGTDTDGDGTNDEADDDIDGDGIPNDEDADVDGDGTDENGTDTDGDGTNDEADDDIDGDGIPNDEDADADGDGTDENGTDTDGDGTNDEADDDIDGDGIPNDEDADVDGDGTNENGTDTDGDGTNDEADDDIDGDGIPNDEDADVDGDGSVDNGTDTDGDGTNDEADDDIDGDGVPNADDADVDGDGTNDNGTDTDGDGTNDEADDDIDGDGIPNDEDADVDGDGSVDNGTDTDGDGTNDEADDDIDGDGIPNDEDADADGDGTDENGTDTDGDGTNDEADSDIDGDGVVNTDDAFPLDPEEDTDTDGDGEGDNSDTDIDGDGIDNDSDSDVDGDGVLDNGTDVDGDGINDANDEPSVGQDIRSYNAVTPNGDGVHDEFMIENLTAYPNNRLQIVNRWGAVVYESQNYGTTGNYFVGEHYQTGEMLPGGVYYYTFQYTTPAGDTQYKQGYLYLGR